MWMMMDSNDDDGREFKLPPDTVIGRKLRPLMPRPLSSSTTPYSTPSCCYIRNPNMVSWNHSSSDEGVKREIQVVSTRWNPTPEQLQALEEMYRRGIRTPSAEQIQQIAAKLGRFGKIQGKNVFYWFQNHKARERQKKRRQLELLAGKNTNHQPPPPPPPPPPPAAGVMNHEKTKKVPIASTATEDSASMHGAVIAAAGKDGWNHNELQQQSPTPTAQNEIRWQLNLELSSNSSNRLGQENIKPCLPSNPINFDAHQTLDLFPTPTPPSPPPPPPPPPPLQLHIPPHFAKTTPTQFFEFLPIIRN